MKVLLHICCGVCAAGVVERLTLEGHRVLGLFYNPNIHPQEEYNRRLEVTLKVAKELNFSLEVASYTPEEWFQETGALENEPEGGKRCEVCFRHRLEKTYLYMLEHRWDAFATTLTIGPRKKSTIINQIGQSISRDHFLIRDFKKKDGFKRANELAKKWDIYRQNYCGCVYSMQEKE